MDRKLRADLALMFLFADLGRHVCRREERAGPHRGLRVSCGAFYSCSDPGGGVPSVCAGKDRSRRDIRRLAPRVFYVRGLGFQTTSLQYTTAANSGFVTGSSVVLVPLLLGMFWGRRLTNWLYAGSFATLIGLYFLTVPAEGLRYLNYGDVLTFIAAGLYAVHIILVKEFTGEHSVSALSLIQVAGSAAMAWLMTGAGAAIHWQSVRFEWRWELLAALGVCAVFATAVAFTVQLWAQQYTSPSHAAILFALEPVFAVSTSYFVLQERLTTRAMKGAGPVIAGIFIAELLGAPAAPESPERILEGRIYFKPWWRPPEGVFEF